MQMMCVFFSHSYTYMCAYIYTVYAFLYIFFTCRKHMIIQYVFSYVHRFIDIHIIISISCNSYTVIILVAWFWVNWHHFMTLQISTLQSQRVWWFGHCNLPAILYWYWQHCAKDGKSASFSAPTTHSTHTSSWKALMVASNRVAKSASTLGTPEGFSGYAPSIMAPKRTQGTTDRALPSAAGFGL